MRFYSHAERIERNTRKALRGEHTVSKNKTTAVSDDNNNSKRNLDAMLNETESVTLPASGKVSLSTLLKADTASARMSVFSTNQRLCAACETSDASIVQAQQNRTRSLIATVRGICGLILLKDETPVDGYRRMLFGNGRSHFSSFLKLPECKIVNLPYSDATACVNADDALATYADTDSSVRVMFATK